MFVIDFVVYKILCCVIVVDEMFWYVSGKSDYVCVVVFVVDYMLDNCEVFV